jgi:putative MFS transporter
VFGISTIILLAGAISVVVLGVRTRGKSLEEIAAEELGAKQEPVGV